MSAEKDKETKIDPRIKGVYKPLCQKVWKSIFPHLVDNKLMDEEINVLYPFTESGMLAMLDRIAEGVYTSLSNATISPENEDAQFDEITLIESFGLDPKHVSLNVEEDRLTISFNHSGSPIKTMETYLDEEKAVENKLPPPLVELRQPKIKGYYEY